jgi:hypothetical protein
MLQVAVINESQAITDDEVEAYLPVFTAQWNNDLASIWPVVPSQFLFLPKNTQPAAGSWWVVFLDDSDQAAELAYHDLTNEGLPLSKVFVKTIQADNSSISVGATHEVCEMAVDPWLNSAYQDPHGTFWASEVCDPVEDSSYGYQIDGILVTDFVTPNWFGHKNAQPAVDFKGHAQSAFQVLPKGYAQRFTSPAWQQVNGSEAVTSSRAIAPPKGSRRERRRRGQNTWNLSQPQFSPPR